MSDNKHEQLSALMDGEVAPADCGSIIHRLCHDQAADEKACWERYHLISDALKNNLPGLIKHDLSARIQAALVDEPTVLAPRRSTIEWSHFKRPLVGAAIAASVASVSIVGLRLILPESAGVAGLAALSAPTTVAENDPAAAEAATRLNGYLVNHNEFAASTGIQALPPYMRVVGFEPEAAQQ